MKFIIVCNMSGISHKLIVLLLSLMMVLLPLQGLAARADIMPADHDMSGPAMQMDMNRSDMAANTAVSCSGCADGSTCCEGSSCDLHQCASCVVLAFFPQSCLYQPRRVSVISGFLREGSLLSGITSLYRPPQV